MAGEIRPEIFSFALKTRGNREDGNQFLLALAKKLAQAKIRNLNSPDFSFSPLKGEIDYELKRLKNSSNPVFGLLYEGFRIMELYQELIPPSERNLKQIHIVFTNQLIGTWDKGSGRFHARVSIYGFPSIISTSGVIEGPAKPRQYYLRKQQRAASTLTLGLVSPAKGGTDPGELEIAPLKEEFKGKFIDYEDQRLTEVLKGYVMQAIFYHLTGEAFCEDSYCRLYNAHWQEELIQAQLNGDYEFCPYHQRLLENLQYTNSKSQTPRQRRGNVRNSKYR